jgi:hypothetical protein
MSDPDMSVYFGQACDGELDRYIYGASGQLVMRKR